MQEENILIFAAIFLTCSICQWVAWRLKLPAIIFLLAAGITAGPVLGLLDPARLLGDLFYPFVSLAVAVILFEGGLSLKFREIAGMGRVVWNMISFGMLVTWLITTVATRYAVNTSWELAFLFGSITVVTGPTVIVPMLRAVRPTAAVSNILRWEGIVIDSIGASLAVLVYQFIVIGGGQQALVATLATLGQLVAVGTVVGVAGGYLFGLLLRHHWLPEFLQNLATLTLVCATFALANHLQPEAGLVTVTVMGVWLANMTDIHLDEIINFKESLSLLLISLLFILLASRLDFGSFRELGWSALVVFGAIQFLARPLNVMVSALGSRLTWPERHILAWIAPRGIVAAAISALFALRLQQAGFAEARFLVPLTFMVIIGTVLLQSITARPIAQWLGVAEPEPRGFLVIGANDVARTIARGLMQNGQRVLVADTSREKISLAKMEGLRTYLGNPISVHADRHLDLVGIGRMLALSPHEGVNVSAIMHYRMEFGNNNVFMLQSRAEEQLSDREKVPARSRGQVLFGSRVTYGQLAGMLASSGEIRTTKLTDSFSFEDFIKKHGVSALPLFAVDPRERFHVLTGGKKIWPGPGWQVISIVADRAEMLAAGVSNGRPACPARSGAAEVG